MFNKVKLFIQITLGTLVFGIIAGVVTLTSYFVSIILSVLVALATICLLVAAFVVPEGKKKDK